MIGSSQQQADHIGSLEDDLAESKSSYDTLKITVSFRHH